MLPPGESRRVYAPALLRLVKKTDRQTDRQTQGRTDGPTPGRYITHSAGRGRPNHPFPQTQTNTDGRDRTVLVDFHRGA